jgi:hypothetical protein
MYATAEVRLHSLAARDPGGCPGAAAGVYGVRGMDDEGADEKLVGSAVRIQHNAGSETAAPMADGGWKMKIPLSPYDCCGMSGMLPRLNGRWYPVKDVNDLFAAKDAELREAVKVAINQLREENSEWSKGLADDLEAALKEHGK